MKGKCLKLVSLNVEQNKHFETVLPFLLKESPDVICFQEVLKSDLSKYELALKKKSFFKPLWKGSVSLGFTEMHGVAILADDFKRTHHEYYYGSEDAIVPDRRSVDVKNVRNESQLPIITADIFNKKDKKIYRIATTHLTWTWEGESTSFQLKDAQKLLSVLETEGELVLTGDFNAPRGRKTFSLIETKYKDNIPLKYKTSLDQNLHKAKGLEYMVDGLFTTPAYVAEDVHFVDGVSDHMAVISKIWKL